jgi:hypothetical protein
MRFLSLRAAGRPSPTSIAARAVVVTGLLLWMANVCASQIVGPLLHPIRGAIETFGGEFRVLGLELASEGGRTTMRLRADLQQPIELAGRTLYPLNWNAEDAGWMQVDLAPGGLLLYPVLLLTLAFTWPAAQAHEWVMRLGIALPLAFLVFLVPATVTLLAELWFPIHDDHDPGSTWPLLISSRFLMGGGGQVLSLFLGLVSIALGKLCVRGGERREGFGGSSAARFR